jgi:DNA-binding CsgD family transcriptional regulator
MDAALQAGAGATLRGLFDGPALGLSLVMDELAYGVVLATLKGQLLHANQAARHELARRKVVALHEGHVHTVDDAQGRGLVQALARAETGRRSLVALRCNGTRLSVAVVPLRADRSEDAQVVALIFSRVSVCDAVMLCFFARTHGLTPSEEQVLSILCQGYSAPEAAQQLNVAVSTVRSHVRSLCAKTHSNGVRALVGQVAVLPPIGAAHLHDPLH